MKTKLLASEREKTWAVIFDPGDEIIGGLTSFAESEGIEAARFTAVGGFERMTLGFFDRATRDYQKIPVEDQVEALTVAGDIALHDGGRKVHAHAVVGRRDGSTRGGHVLDGNVWPTLEVVVVESPKYLRRTMKPEIGLALIDLES